MDVLGIGYAAIDYLFVVPRFPHLDEKLEYTDFSIQGGGPAATALVTLARLGVKVSYAGCIGDDKEGDFIAGEFEKEHVDTTHLIRQKNKSSPFSFIMVDAQTGKRTILWRRKQLDPYPEKLINEAMLKRCKILHLDGFEPEAAMKAVKLARKNNVTVVVDGGSVKEGSEMLLKESDYFVASEVFSRTYTGEEDKIKALKSLYKENKRCVVITFGEEGSVGIRRGKILEIPAYKVNVNDTTGAGDVYHGAFVYGILQGWDLKKKMKFASAVAAIKCMFLGGREGIPGLGKALDFIKSQSNLINSFK